MPESLSDELNLFQKNIIEFLKNNIDLPSDEIKQKSVQSGYYSMQYADLFGETSADCLKMVLAREAIAAFGIYNQEDILGRDLGVLKGVEGALKKEYLIPVIEGQKSLSFAYTESDPDNPTVAVKTKNTLIVNGIKSYVSNAKTSDFICVVLDVQYASKTDKKATVIVDSNSEGFSIKETFQTLDGSDHSIIEFKNVKVPYSNLITSKGEVSPIYLNKLLQERIDQSAIAVGFSMFAMDFITKKLTEPHRTGILLANKEGIRLRYSDMRIKTYAARSVLYRTARLLQQRKGIINEVTIAKFFCTETAFDVIDTAMQLGGGSALILGSPLEVLYKKIRSMRIAGGANDILRLSISKGVFEFGSGIL